MFTFINISSTSKKKGWYRYEFCMSNTWKYCYQTYWGRQQHKRRPVLSLCLQFTFISFFHFLSSFFWKFLLLLWYFVATLNDFESQEVQVISSSVVCMHYGIEYLPPWFLLCKPGSSALSNRQGWIFFKITNFFPWCCSKSSPTLNLCFNTLGLKTFPKSPQTAKLFPDDIAAFRKNISPCQSVISPVLTTSLDNRYSVFQYFDILWTWWKFSFKILIWKKIFQWQP